MGSAVNDEIVNSITEEEQVIVPNEKQNDQFYKKAQDYWSKIPPTVDGVLGGYGFISKWDLESSEQFLISLLEAKNGPGDLRALDCGAGIGRITKHLLRKFFKTVDLVEQNKEFLDKAHHYIGRSKKIGKLYCTGLQSFIPEESYDVIWCQWVLGHLTDNDLIKFLKVCLEALSKNGLIIVKENVTSSGVVEKDEVDSSITRDYDSLVNLILESELDIVKVEQQTKFPKGLYPVKMFALKPKC